MKQGNLKIRSAYVQCTLAAAIALTCILPAATAQTDSTQGNPVSPALRIERTPDDNAPAQWPRPPSGVRSYDGSGNNLTLPILGQAKQTMRRICPAEYSDHISAMAGITRPGPRAISNAVNAQTVAHPNSQNLSDMFWQWGQFLDHDMDLSGGMDPPEPAAIPVPMGDPEFDPQSTGTQTIALNRSIYLPSSGTGIDNPRQQINELSNWIDGSQVYGSSEERALALRTLDGTGRLRSSANGQLLPLALNGEPAPEAAYEFFAGDARVDEQVGLTSMHTLFMREHNHQATRLHERHPTWTDEQLYQGARAIVGAEIEKITYDEFLPLLIGKHALPRYSGYHPTADAGIANEFSTAAFRLGHTLLSPILLRLDAQGNSIPQGPLSLADSFFTPTRIRDEGGIEPILRGLTSQVCQELDVQIVDEVRNFLFGLPGAGGFDLPALNIQRGRDHGLPSYNVMRGILGLPLVQSFAEISSDADTRQRLANAYTDPDQIDLWVGLLAEDHRADAQVGETLYRILRQQFLGLRDGDRFWWASALPKEHRLEVTKSRLIDIIRRNTTIGSEVDDDPWHAG